MTGTERKRAWRLAHPEQSAQAERERAQARRDGHYGQELGSAPRLCASHDSYWRYEHSDARLRQRIFWPRYGAGAHHMTPEEFKAAGVAILAQAEADTGVTLDSIWQEAADYRRRMLAGIK